MSNVVNFILCGGAGTRLWPISRKKMPKQFLPLINGRSLFQETVKRNSAFSRETVVITSMELKHLAQRQLKEESVVGRFVLEPIGRNTAPAIGLAALTVDSDDIVLVTTSDHVIRKQAAFEEAVAAAVRLAEAGNIVAFGIEPTYAEIGFGYIEYTNSTVHAFREKPDQETAEIYLQSGCHLWNSGMFCFKASVLLEELKRYAPEIHQGCLEAVKLLDRQAVDLIIDADAMAAIPAMSIDYAVMEHTQRIKVVPCDLGWSDLGSFDTLYTEFAKETAVSHRNVQLHVNVDQNPSCLSPIFQAATGNLVVSSSRVISLIDVEDLIVVDTADALLITKRGKSQAVSTAVRSLRELSSPLTTFHTTTAHMWGSVRVLFDEPGYSVKRIVVYPDQRIPPFDDIGTKQWTVVEGSAWICCGEDEIELGVEQSISIAQGTTYSLENRSPQKLVLVEVHIGP